MKKSVHLSLFLIRDRTVKAVATEICRSKLICMSCLQLDARSTGVNIDQHEVTSGAWQATLYSC